MFARVMMTGMPGYLHRTVLEARGTSVAHRELLAECESKDAFMTTLKAISNTGNYMIGEGALRCLPERTTHMPFWHLHNQSESPEFFASIRRDFDVCVFTAANLIRRDLSAENEARILERIDLPLVILGIGIQREADLAGELPKGTLRFLQLLRDRNAFVMTRGHVTADFLRANGIHNAVAAGCPSMFSFKRKMLESIDALRSATISPSTRFVFSGYLGSENPLETISDINGLVGPSGTASYVLQDEPVAYGMEIGGSGSDLIYDSCNCKVIGSVAFKFQDQIRKSVDMFAFFDTNQWRTWAGFHDLSLQRRFHGCIATMQAGVPTVSIAVDDRMREMLNFIGFPYLDKKVWEAQENRSDFLRDFLTSVSPEGISEQYVICESSFRRHLRDAGLS